MVNTKIEKCNILLLRFLDEENEIEDTVTKIILETLINPNLDIILVRNFNGIDFDFKVDDMNSAEDFREGHILFLKEKYEEAKASKQKAVVSLITSETGDKPESPSA